MLEEGGDGLLAGTHQAGNLKALFRSIPNAIDDRVYINAHT